jgi:hypothetical protein
MSHLTGGGNTDSSIEEMSHVDDCNSDINNIKRLVTVE